jgi:GTP-binding protein YchF
MIIGIVGLPNSGKTTIFNALTGGEVETAAYSTGRFEIHRATVEVPDPRVDTLHELYKPRKTTRARVEYQDIGGMAKGIGDGGLSGELLGAISQSDALLHVVRSFEDEDVVHPEGDVNPARDVALLDTELLLSDLVIVERRLERLSDTLRKNRSGPERDRDLAEQVLLQKVLAALESETPVRDLELSAAEIKTLRGFQLLTAKPILLVLNTNESEAAPAAAAAAVQALSYDHAHTVVLAIAGGLEMELAQLDAEDREMMMGEYGISEPGLNRVIRESYTLLGLMSFFTVGEDEVRAWTVTDDARAVDAAGAIHTDLARGFIRADVVAYADLIAAGSEVEARKAGTARVEGRDYPVVDGDILHVRFNV